MGPVATIARLIVQRPSRIFWVMKRSNFNDGNRAGEGDLIVYGARSCRVGHIQLSDRPGLGVEVNKDFTSNYLMEAECSHDGRVTFVRILVAVHRDRGRKELALWIDFEARA